MASVSLDVEAVARCRTLAGRVSGQLRVEIDAHTTTGIERTVARAIGLEGVDEHGTPLANLLVDRLLAAGQLGYGVAHRVALECAFQGCTPVEAAEQIAASSQPLAAMQGAPAEPACQALRDAIAASVARIDAARAEREARISRLGQGETPLRYLIVATGNIHDDALQAHSAAYAGADIVAVIRATAQSLLDYVPEGATTEGYGGTYATQENFRILRQALDRASEEYGRYVMGCNYSSGLCMSEIAYMGAVERLDMLLNDSMYGILFRDINMRRTVIDQYFSRRVIARAGIIINTGEDNYLTTADAVEAAHTVLASQFINESLGQQAGLEAAQMGLGHAFEIDPEVEDSLLLELAQAQLVRQIFDRHPIKWMPPTKHKTGDIFQSHVQDALFSLVGVTTGQSIQLLGMFSEAVHNPLLMDRFLSLKATRYVFQAARHLGDELQIVPGGRMQRRAEEVLRGAEQLLERVSDEGLWAAIEAGVFGDIKRPRDGGKGLEGVVRREAGYFNPLLDQLEAP